MRRIADFFRGTHRAPQAGVGGQATKRVQMSGLSVRSAAHSRTCRANCESQIDLSTRRHSVATNPAINAPASGVPKPLSAQNASPCALGGGSGVQKAVCTSEHGFHSTANCRTTFTQRRSCQQLLPVHRNSPCLLSEPTSVEVATLSHVWLSELTRTCRSAASLRQAPTTVRHTSTQPQKPHARSP